MRNLVIVAAMLTLVGMACGQGKQVELSGTRLQVLEFKALRDTYRVNEPIRLRVKTNKKAYIYIFNVDERTGEARLIFPNKYMQYNQLKPGQEALIPSGVDPWEIKSPEPGTEKFVLIASTKKQKIQGKTFGEYGFKQMPMEEFNAKFLRLTRKPRGEQEPGFVMAEYKVTVVQETRPGTSPSITTPTSGNNPMVLLNIYPRVDWYNVGDTVRVAFGATGNGYIYMALVYPDGRTEKVKEARVVANKIYQEKFLVTRPVGKQLLVAVYSPDKLDWNKSREVSKIFETAKTKGAKGLVPLSNQPQGTEAFDFVEIDVRG